MNNIINFTDAKEKYLKGVKENVKTIIEDDLADYIIVKIKFILDTIWFGFDPEAGKTPDEYLDLINELSVNCVSSVITPEVFGLLTTYEFFEKLDIGIKEFIFKEMPKYNK